MRESALNLVGMGEPQPSTELAVRGRRLVIERELGRGTTSTVWRARDAVGPLTLKLGLSAAQRPRFADECARLAWVGSPELPLLLDAGLLREGVRLPDGSRLDAGVPFLALGWVAGEALDVLASPRGEREALALALVVARDVARGLADLHASGAAHGDVKPSNIVVEYATDGRPLRARLVDLGLAVESSEVVPRGGTRRYLAPEVNEVGGDARLRDLFALGFVLAEVLSPEFARREHSSSSTPAWTHLPGELGRLARALASSAPAARPSAAWAARRAAALLGEPESAEAAALRRRAAVRRAYLSVRRDDVVAAARFDRVDVVVPGQPGVWLGEALSLARSLAELRGDAAAAGRTELGESTAYGRARLLVTLVGPLAASWPESTFTDDVALVERLLELAGQRELESLAFSDLASAAERERGSLAETDVVDLALALAAGATESSVLDEVEARVEAGRASEALALALARSLRRRGQLGRALAVLERTPGDAARADAAELSRRAGDASAAENMLVDLLSRPLPAPARARAIATAARLLLDRGDARGAADRLEGEPDATPVLETRALALLALGERGKALVSVERALALASTDEERARIEAVRGNVAHAAGDAEGALRAFRLACEHASRAGAVLEEATYLTGLAASASSLGELGDAIRAARRAVLLFEALGRRVEAARATLSVAASHAAEGAVDEAREAALDAAQRAKAAGDRRCAGFAHLVLADIHEAPSLVGLEHARYARSQLTANDDDVLRAAARLELHGESGLDREHFDALGRAATTALDARLEWWGVRAAVEARRAEPRQPEAICAELAALASGPVVARGPALAAGARLAARSGDGEMARRLTLSAGDAARELLRRATPERRAAIASLSWVRAAEVANLEARFSEAQIADVEALVRALGRRDRLRVLLRQVVDALVLWTGVERGLLLLRGPGGLLRPRAARNLARSDLTGPQLELSRSLAERALEAGEPVVAVDAAGDLPAMHASVHALKLRSVLAVPLVAHGEALGVVYLDDRVRRGAFGPAELGWVRLVATLAAVAISDARAQLLLRRSARRAERAEARLARELARREAELDVVERELARATRGRDTRFAYDAIVGESEAVRAMLRMVDRVTASEVPVLVNGESGSGKELVARAIHANGPRARGPFVTENCGAVPETLLESTLFGHVRGAFTGAVRPRAGLFEVAHHGTLFLDEIAEMSLGMQAKLLRALQDGEIRPVGSESIRRVDVRVIGATHRDLEALVRAGKFREDLLYRLNVIAVRVPPLRERSGDVPILVQHFVKAHAGDRKIRMSRAALDALSAYAWPGNVRQLENEVRRALVLSDETVLLENLSPDVRDRATGEAQRVDGLNLRHRLDTLEAELVRIALRRTEGNQTRAAELLGVSRFGLQKMMKRLDIKLEHALAGRGGS
jgi:serine/threonine-protein kinase PknK